MPRLAPLEGCAIVGGQSLALAAAFFKQAQLTTALFLGLTNLAAALLVGLGLAGSRGVDSGRDDFDGNGNNIDRRPGDGATG